MERAWAVLVVFIAVLAAASPTTALVLYPNADTYVRSNNSGYGSSSVLLVKYNDSGFSYHRKAWIRYELSSLTHRDFTDASLNLPFVESGVGSNATGNWSFSVYGLTDESLDGWSEATTRWNNAPGNNTGSPNGVDPARTTFLGGFTVPGKGIGTWTISGSDLENFLGADTNNMVTFIVCRDTQAPSGSVNYAHGIASREHGSSLPASLDLPHAAAGPPPVPFAHEGFSYDPGDLDGQNGGIGWGGAWLASGGVEQVVAPIPPLEYVAPDGPSIDGGDRALQFSGNSNQAATRVLGQTWSADDVYASMLLRWEAGTPNDNDFLVVRFGGSGGPQFGLKIDQGPQNQDFVIRLGEAGQPDDYAGQLTPQETYFLVVHLGKGADPTHPDDYDQLDIWLNPAFADSGSPVETLIAHSSTAISSFSFIDFRAMFLDSDDLVLVDELRLGTTWNDVMNYIPEPATFALLGGGLLFLARRRASRARRPC